MPTASKKSSKKVPQKQVSRIERLRSRYDSYKKNRTHRSFRLTPRRDYVRPLELPGMFAFTYEVTKTLLKYKTTFLLLALTYIVIYGLLIGLQSQETYLLIADTLRETGQELFSSGWNLFQQTGGILLSIGTLGLASEVTEVQQVLSAILFIMMWLTVVWLLRNLLAGHKVTLRDGLYSSGSPLFAMVVIGVVIMVQLIPVAIAMIGYSAAYSAGIITGGGAAAMLFWLAALLLAVLSLYWITSSLFAMVIVTLPGMYPLKAVKSANQLLLGRKLRILLRWLWLALALVVLWIVTLVPLILFDMWLKSLLPAIEWLPIIPFAILVLSSLSIVWGSAYVYLLYRKVVDYVPAA